MLASQLASSLGAAGVPLSQRADVKRSGDIDVVAAGRRVRLRVPMIGIGAGYDEQWHDLGAVGEVAGPVANDVQRGAGLEPPTPGVAGKLGRTTTLSMHTDASTTSSEGF